MESNPQSLIYIISTLGNILYSSTLTVLGSSYLNQVHPADLCVFRGLLSNPRTLNFRYRLKSSANYQLQAYAKPLYSNSLLLSPNIDQEIIEYLNNPSEPQSSVTPCFGIVLIVNQAEYWEPIEESGQAVPASPVYRKKRRRVTNKPKNLMCLECGVCESPEWRKGPKGPKSLCNACGLRWAKKVKRMKSNSSLNTFTSLEDPNSSYPMTTNLEYPLPSVPKIMSPEGSSPTDYPNSGLGYILSPQDSPYYYPTHRPFLTATPLVPSMNIYGPHSIHPQTPMPYYTPMMLPQLNKDFGMENNSSIGRVEN